MIWCLHVWSFGVPPRHGKLLKLLFPHIRKGSIFGKLLKLLGDGLSVRRVYFGMVGCGTHVNARKCWMFGKTPFCSFITWSSI